MSEQAIHSDRHRREQLRSPRTLATLFAEDCDEAAYRRIAVEEVNPESASLLILRVLVALRLRRLVPGHRFDAALEDALADNASLVFGSGVPDLIDRLAESWHRRLDTITAEIEAETERSYEDYAWGDPPPSDRQFDLTRKLGLSVAYGMTLSDVSALIDSVLGPQKALKQLNEIGDSIAEAKGYARLHGRRAAERFLVDRFGWLPEQVRQLSVDDCLMLLDGENFQASRRPR